MNSLRIDRMRRTLERSRELGEVRRRQQWLASLTPEHRAKHEGRGMLAFGVCSECVNANAAEMNRAVSRWLGTMNKVSR